MWEVEDEAHACIFLGPWCCRHVTISALMCNLQAMSMFFSLGFEVGYVCPPAPPPATKPTPAKNNFRPQLECRVAWGGRGGGGASRGTAVGPVCGDGACGGEEGRLCQPSSLLVAGRSGCLGG